MPRMWGELLLCCGVFAALSVYESLRVAYHRQMEGNRRAGTPTPALASASFWTALGKIVARLIGMISGLALYEKLWLKYNWRGRAARRLRRERQSASPIVPSRLWKVWTGRRSGAADNNRFAIASQRPIRMMDRATTDARTAGKAGEDLKNG